MCRPGGARSRAAATGARGGGGGGVISGSAAAGALGGGATDGAIGGGGAISRCDAEPGSSEARGGLGGGSSDAAGLVDGAVASAGWAGLTSTGVPSASLAVRRPGWARSGSVRGGVIGTGDGGASAAPGAVATLSASVGCAGGAIGVGCGAAPPRSATALCPRVTGVMDAAASRNA